MSQWMFNTADPRTIQSHFLRGYIIGRPKGNQFYTVEQLEQMGMAGIYKRTDDPSSPSISEAQRQN